MKDRVNEKLKNYKNLKNLKNLKKLRVLNQKKKLNFIDGFSNLFIKIFYDLKPGIIKYYQTNFIYFTLGNGEVKEHFRPVAWPRCLAFRWCIRTLVRQAGPWSGTDGAGTRPFGSREGS